MRPEDLDFFKENGYLVLNQLLSDEETARFLNIFERERRDYARFWTNNAIWQTQYCQSLLTAPEFDEIIRHDNVMEPLQALQALMGGEAASDSALPQQRGSVRVAGMRTWDRPAVRV